DVWELLYAHLDEDRLREIHPRIVSGRSIREGEPVEFRGRSFPSVKIAERVVRIGGRASKTTWTYRIEPPVRYRYDIAFSNGSVTRFDNTYSSAKGGTLVQTTGAFSLKRVPSFLAAWLVERSLRESDDEDLAYAKKMNLVRSST
ncbi:MAG: hypothetical protein ACREDF_08040, partial [Thermoplasmata archaeon]